MLHLSLFPDSTLTVDDVTKVMNKIEGDKWEVMECFGIPESLWKEIERRYSTDSEKSRACADYYIYVHPDAAWHHLTKTLHTLGEFTAARESKSFMSTGKYRQSYVSYDVCVQDQYTHSLQCDVVFLRQLYSGCGYAGMAQCSVI